MSTVRLTPLGSAELVDLIGMCPGNGDGVPYPFWRTRRDPYWGDIAQKLPPFGDRFDEELSPLRPWVETYGCADIWVEGRVKAFTENTPDIRLLAHRAGEAGFIAAQHPATDVVDVYRLSPLDLGAAVAGMAKLTQPGSRPAIVLPGFLDHFIDKPADVTDDEDDYDVSIRVNAGSSSRATILDYDNVILLGIVQSRCGPSEVRGVDWARDAVVWVRIRGDGDYVYTSDRGHAVPVTARTLRDRIDQLIAADVAVLRRQRGLT